ncbi:30S ribosome-binding factor RbfA [Sabulicella rubraurantiaca]|uniref:30S ribosome-binding factor RbfA n=1 Tax=Sabulicella rubraurantiaca TaxID=2811429 RepID=UPI001A96C389|nr:30S ribosome-binding factor RbfA [Sabulicella rubraurantiaca]
MANKRPHHDPSQGPSQRQLRVAEEVRHALASVIERGDWQDEALWGVPITVTEVRASPDLKHMTAFVSGLGRDLAPDKMAALKANAPWLRQQVARRVRLKFAPEIHFQPDTALDHAVRMSALMRQPEIARDLQKKDEDGDA